VWEATTGHTLYTYSEQPVPQMMDVAAWSHDDRSLAVGGHGAYLRICEAQTGNVLSSFASGPAYAVAWSPDDTLVVSGGISQARVQIWKVR